MTSILPHDAIPLGKGYGNDSRVIAEKLASIQGTRATTNIGLKPPSPEGKAAAPSKMSQVTLSSDSAVFDALAAAKIATSQVSMHMDPSWREKLFRQLDSLHAVENWESDDRPVALDSFRTFLRMMLAFAPIRRPGLSLGRDGRIVGAWTRDRDRLTIEYLPGDELRYVLTRYLKEKRESAAGQTGLVRLRAVLAPYEPERWFTDGERQ